MRTLAKTAAVAGSLLLGATFAAGPAAADFKHWSPWCKDGRCHDHAKACDDLNGLEIDTDNFAFGGSGCKGENSVDVGFIDFGGIQQLSVLYANLAAELGEGALAPANRRWCGVLIPIKVPEKCQFSITKAQIVGAAQIPWGATGKGQTSFGFSFFGPRSTVTEIIRGPFDEFDTPKDWSEERDFRQPVWSPCGEDVTLQIISDVFLDLGKKGRGGPKDWRGKDRNHREDDDDYALMQLYLANGEPTQKFNVNWRKCDDRKPGDWPHPR